MSRLINDMLLLSQADAHTFPVHLKPTECDTLLLNSYEAFEPMAREKKLSLTVSLPSTTLPPCSSDGERFNQITAILLHNAISYTPQGGSINLSLSLNTAKKPELLTLSVADSGIGLSIASEIVHSLGGTIRVTDTPGGGSTFLVCLPFHPVSGPDSH